MRAALLAGLLLPTLATPQRVDLIARNGKIWTGTGATVSAIAVQGERIIAIGTDAEISRMAGSATRIIDLNGRRAVPGFNDAHVHFFSGGSGRAGVQLRNARSQEDFRNRIAAFARQTAKGRWILEGYWDHENWTPAELPSRGLIDAVTPDNPVLVQRLEGSGDARERRRDRRRAEDGLAGAGCEVVLLQSLLRTLFTLGQVWGRIPALPPAESVLLQSLHRTLFTLGKMLVIMTGRNCSVRSTAFGAGKESRV